MNGLKQIKIKKSPINGLGVYASSPIEAGEKIAYFEGYEITHDTKYSLTINNKKIEPTGKLKHLNHSCSANAYFEDLWLIAAKAILPEEEITIDYEATESVVAHSFNCQCASRTCRKVIGTANKSMHRNA